MAAAALCLPASAAAATAVQIRHVDLAGFPEVRVTAVVPAGARPTLWEGSAPAQFARPHQLGAEEAIVLAVDNSHSMRGEPLHQATSAAGDFLAQQERASATGLVAFGHQALDLTRANESREDVTRTLSTLAADPQGGTSLYDAVVLSVARLQHMSSGMRILVLLTDGKDLGSHNSLSGAIAAARRANVVVYSIAAGASADKTPLRALAAATGGKVFDAADAGSLGSTYRALSQELDRTWQISYLTSAGPGERVLLSVRAAGARAAEPLRIPGTAYGRSESGSIAHSGYAAAFVVLLVALLLSVAGVAANRRLRKSEIGRLVDKHVKGGDRRDENRSRGARFDGLVDWTERSIGELPGSKRLTRAVECSGVKVRVGHLPYLAGLSALVLGIVATALNASPALALLCMVAGLGVPLLVLQVAASRRRKAFDRQLPDVLSTIASTLRAGHGLRPAIRAIADDGSPPASEEFARVLGEERLGRPLDQALAGMCERIGSADFEYVATAVNVQSQVGGSMAGLFDTLSETVRERQRHARKVHALTSMGRLSAAILISLPFGLVLIMSVINPSYMAPLFTTSVGHLLIGFCLVSMTIGGLILKRIVTVGY
ncbi:MAG TPA: VWA domain-containing protein [Gaiellaceae bacterium]|nr:VWA domain-containing protein [Gaiellaceae bacterium]